MQNRLKIHNAALNNVLSPQFNNLNNFIVDAFDEVDLTHPQAYLVYLYFNGQDMTLNGRKSGIIKVGEANQLGFLQQENIVASEDGYVFVFPTNRSYHPVHFDNLEVRRWKPMVSISYDYYPFGLMWENPPLPSTDDAAYDCTYHEKEFQFAEFSDGHGMALYDFEARIRSSNTEDMVVRKNAFTRLDYANLANGDNAGVLNQNGLRYICNTNEENGQDFVNTDFLGVPNSAVIGLVQKELEGAFEELGQIGDWPTGNAFSIDNGNIATNFRNEGVAITEYWKSDLPEEDPLDFEGILGFPPFNGNYHLCPSQFTGPVIVLTPPMIQTQLDLGLISKFDADQYRYIYLLLLDGGNTIALQQYVENTWGSQVWTTREELLNISPFVTSTVLIAMLNNTQVYPHAIAFEILMANPDVLEDPKFVSFLSTKDDPMPQYFIDLLLNNGPSGTSRSQMQKILAEKRTGHISKVSDVVWAMMDYDDDTYLESDFIDVFEKIQTLNSEMSIIEMMLDDGLTAEALLRTSDIENVVPMDLKEKPEYLAFVDWVNLRISMISGGRTWDTMSASDFTTLNLLKQKFDTYASYQAIEIINNYRGEDYFTPPAYGCMGRLRSKTESSAEGILSMQIYPNPANAIATITFEEKIPTSENCELVIVDLIGNEVYCGTFNPSIKQIPINTTKFPAGMYFFKIRVPNMNLKLDGKFEVTH